MKTNWKVVVYSLVALACLGLMFFVDWLFIIPAIVLMILNHKELFKKSKK